MASRKYESVVNIIWSQDPDVSFQTKLARAWLGLQRKENEKEAFITKKILKSFHFSYFTKISEFSTFSFLILVPKTDKICQKLL